MRRLQEQALLRRHPQPDRLRSRLRGPGGLQPTLVILAAGSGSRYGGAKQLDRVGPGGEALLEYAAYDARRAGFDRVVLVVRPEHEADFRARLAGKLEVRFARQVLDDLPAGFAPPPERNRPWGTAHAVLAAAPELDRPFAVVNADDFYGAGPYRLLAEFLGRAPSRGPLELALVAFEVGRTLSEAGPVSRALCELDGRGSLERISEIERAERRGGRITYREGGREGTLRGDEWVSMNCWAFPLAILAELRRRFETFLSAGVGRESEYRLPDVVQELVREDRARVEVLPADGAWLGMTFLEDRPRVVEGLARLVRGGRYPLELWGRDPLSGGRARGGGGPLRSGRRRRS